MVQTLDKQGSPYYDASIKPPATDLAAAQKLIDQVVADTGGPVEFTLDVFNTPYIAQDGQLLQAQLAQLKNVHVTLNVGASATIVQRYTTGNFQATLAGPRWNEPGIDMVTWFSSASTQNWMKYSSPTVDSALQKLVSATDEPTRVTQAHTVEQQVLKDSPVAWYAGFASGTEFAKRVQGYVSYFDQVPLMDSVWVSDAKG
jgi:peptide/nickel transport system substrate-binding protein